MDQNWANTWGVRWTPFTTTINTLILEPITSSLPWTLKLARTITSTLMNCPQWYTASPPNWLPGAMTSPGLQVRHIFLPSRCSKVNLKPQRASRREIFFSTIRSMSFLLKVGWSICCRITITSPSSPSGYEGEGHMTVTWQHTTGNRLTIWSAAPRKGIFCSCFMPGVIGT